MGKNLHILIVNSDKAVREQLIHGLVSAGYSEILEASDGYAAIHVLNSCEVDVLITDITLGMLDAWRLARLVRSGALKTKSDIPIVIVATTYSARITEVTAKAYEINKFIAYEDLYNLPSVLDDILHVQQDPPKASLVVIEDYPDTIELVKRILSKRFDIDIATDGESGVKIWKAKRHDLVLLDIMLPKQSGDDVLNEILNEDPNQSVVVMTAHCSPQRAGELILSGAVDYIEKPFRSDQLRKVCEIAVRREDFIVSNEEYAQHIDAMQKSEEKYRRLVETLKDDYFFYSRDCLGEYSYISPSILNVIGYSSSEYVSNHEKYFTDNPINQKAQQHFQSSLLGEQQPPYEIEIYHENGEKLRLEITETPIINKNKEIVSVDGIAHNVTARIETQEQLRKLADATFEAVVIHDNGKIIEANQNFEELTNYRRYVDNDDSLYDFVAPESRGSIEEYFAGENHLKHYLEIQMQNKTGDVFPVEIRNRWINYNGKRRQVTAIRDLTEQRRAEQEREQMQQHLRQAQKMESLGQLTGGVAHDFNNILASVLGYTTLTRDRFAKDKAGKLYEYLTEVCFAAEKGRDLIKQMLAFSRGSIASPEPCVLTTYVTESIKMLRSTVPASINIDTKFDDDIPLVKADVVQLSQIIMNLCINARDSIKGEVGKINIHVHHSVFEDKHCSSCHKAINGDFVSLKVEDTGEGVDSQNINNIFEPFFTTKEVGKGTGLGLSMVHGIMHDYGGHIVVESTVGSGTCFTLLFPVCDNKLENTKNDDIILAEEKCEGKILVVDDDPILARYLGEVLTDKGFDVTVINDPCDALAVFVKAPEDIDLVITDQTMPNMPGDVMAQMMLKVRSELPIILCTGHSERIDAEIAQKLNISGFLNKPFEMDKLTSMMHKLLKSSSDKLIAKYT